MARHPVSRSFGAWLALPLVPVYWILTSIHRGLYALGILGSRRISAPVVVVGNITTGGTGKSPLTRHIALALAARGWRPGIALRGFGATAPKYPASVLPASDPSEVGDEAIEHAVLTGLPVVVDPVRANAATSLVRDFGCDLVICDDGLQHWAIERDIELAVLDGDNPFGNGWLLPAGALRESRRRLNRVDYVVINQRQAAKRVDLPDDAWTMRIGLKGVVNLGAARETEPLSVLEGKKLLAVTALGNPDRVAASLTDAGLEIARRDFDDHHEFTLSDLELDEDTDMVITGKDAVKIEPLVSGHALAARIWRLVIEVEVDSALVDAIDGQLKAD